MLIFLIGFMGSGKTTAGRRLARKLGYEFADLDVLIEEHEGMEITEIFAHKGEEYFRNAETKVLDNLLDRSRLVVACGGGTPCFHDNMRKMKTYGITVYLKVSSGILASRLSRSPSVRPLVAGKDGDELNNHVRKLLAGREGWYRQADLVYEADNFNLESLIEKINSHLKETN
jgi:shikimate kinase